MKWRGHRRRPPSDARSNFIVGRLNRQIHDFALPFYNSSPSLYSFTPKIVRFRVLLELRPGGRPPLPPRSPIATLAGLSAHAFRLAFCSLLNFGDTILWHPRLKCSRAQTAAPKGHVPIGANGGGDEVLSVDWLERTFIMRVLCRRIYDCVGRSL